VLDAWGKRMFIFNNKIFSFAFFLFIPFATQLFSTLFTSSNLRNQASFFTELRLLQATHRKRSPYFHHYAPMHSRNQVGFRWADLPQTRPQIEI